MQDVSQYEGAAYAQRMSDALAAAQHIEPGADLQSACDVNQPDHSEKGDLVVQYADNSAYKGIAKQLAPMLGDLKVGCKLLQATWRVANFGLRHLHLHKFLAGFDTPRHEGG
jgi:hypothetical protein